MPIQTVFMMNCKFGEIVLIAFPFTSGVGSKKRPALVLYDAGDPDILVARITSQIVLGKDDLVLNDLLYAGLLVPSTIRLYKVATLEKSLISRTLGTLSVRDERAVVSHLKMAAEGLP